MRDKRETNALSIESMRTALFGEKLQYEFDPHSLNKTGTAHGVIIGGNLSVIYALLGTPMALDPIEKILFIEDVDEYLYHIDRMMQSLRLSGYLGKLKGMIVGRMSKMNDNEIPYGLDAQQIIHEIMREYNIPLCFDFPAGHEEPNLALIMGREVELQVLDQQCTLKFKPSTECKQMMNK